MSETYHTKPLAILIDRDDSQRIDNGVTLTQAGYKVTTFKNIDQAAREIHRLIGRGTPISLLVTEQDSDLPTRTLSPEEAQRFMDEEAEEDRGSLFVSQPGTTETTGIELIGMLRNSPTACVLLTHKLGMTSRKLQLNGSSSAIYLAKPADDQALLSAVKQAIDAKERELKFPKAAEPKAIHSHPPHTASRPYAPAPQQIGRAFLISDSTPSHAYITTLKSAGYTVKKFDDAEAVSKYLGLSPDGIDKARRIPDIIIASSQDSKGFPELLEQSKKFGTLSIGILKDAAQFNPTWLLGEGRHDVISVDRALKERDAQTSVRDSLTRRSQDLGRS